MGFNYPLLFNYFLFNYVSTHIFNDPSFKGEGDNPNSLCFCHRSQSVLHSKSRSVVVVVV